jgi:hypothetical protein
MEKGMETGAAIDPNQDLIESAEYPILDQVFGAIRAL